MGGNKEKTEKITVQGFQQDMAEQYGTNLITTETLAENIEFSLRTPQYANLVVGLSGIGKTETVRGVCEKLAKKWSEKIDCETIILSQCNEGDLQGLPYADRATGTTVRYPFKSLPTVESVKAGRHATKGVLFLDELNRASREVQNGAFQLLGERRVGDSHLHPGWVVWAAINPERHEYLVNKMDPAMLNRCTVYCLKVDAAAWLNWADSVKLNPCVIDFIASNIDALYNIDAHGTGAVFATPRSWERVARYLDELIRMKIKPDKDGKIQVSYNQMAKIIQDKNSPIVGVIGTPLATRFISYMKDYVDQLNPVDLLEHYLESNDSKNSAKPWGGMRQKVLESARKNALGMLSNTNEQLLLTITDKWPNIFSGKKKTLDTMTKEFNNLHQYWDDITVIASDKAVALYSGILGMAGHASEADSEFMKKHATWCADLQAAVNIMAEEYASQGKTHFSSRLTAAARHGYEQKAAYAGTSAN